MGLLEVLVSDFSFEILRKEGSLVFIREPLIQVNIHVLINGTWAFIYKAPYIIVHRRRLYEAQLSKIIFINASEKGLYQTHLHMIRRSICWLRLQGRLILGFEVLDFRVNPFHKKVPLIGQWLCGKMCVHGLRLRRLLCNFVIVILVLI